MSRGLDLATTNRNIVSSETHTTDRTTMSPFLVSGVSNMLAYYVSSTSLVCKLYE